MDELKKKKLQNILQRQALHTKDDAPLFIAHEEGDFEEKDDGLFIVLKEFFKKYPFLYDILTAVFGALALVRVEKKFRDTFGSEHTVLNLGTGPLQKSNDIIAVDYFPYQNVDLVADITDMPIKDDAIDAIICEYVLEHTKDPEKIMKEIFRVLKPGGKAGIAVPFVATFHSAPDDYYRWTALGLKESLERAGFEVETVEISVGPTSAFLNVLSEWVAVLLSFGIKKLHSVILIIMLILTAPFNLLDLILHRFPHASNTAHAFYTIATKPQK